MYWKETVFIKGTKCLLLLQDNEKKKKTQNAILINYRYRLFYFSDYKLNDYLFILFEFFKN